MTLPNFLIVGAPKAGTTSLYHYLKQHPQVYMSPVKEPHYLSFGEMDLTGRFVHKPRGMVLTAGEYERLFDRVRDETAIGEASTTYLASRRAADRIAARLPGARLIAVLRQPADRAYSSYLMYRQLFAEKAETFEAALEAEQYAIDHNKHPYLHYRDIGYYSQQLNYYYQLFPKQQVQVCVYEDLLDRPLDTIKQIFAFLEVDDTFVPDMSLKYNVSGLPRNTVATRLLKLLHPVRHRIVRALPARLVSGVGQTLLKAPGLNPETRAALTAHFREDILRLQDLIDRDLSYWLR
ncbi:MAG: sulfotransferase [Chromatiales bacterium]